MSKYTTEVRFICEKEAGFNSSVGYSKVDEVLDKSWEKIFANFPIFDETYRSVLCKKILKHYYTREIGYETVGLWKLKLDMMMNEIMPYYNELYKTTLLEFDPFRDADYYKDHKGRDSGSGEESGTHTGTVNDENSHTGTVTDENDHTGTVGDSGTHGGTVGDSGSHGGTVGDSGTHGGTVNDAGSKSGERHEVVNDDATETSWDVYSDTPQGALTNVDNETYLTNARKITDSSERDVATDSAYSETDSNLRTYNETTGNTRTYNETTGNTRTYNETTGNTRTYNEANDNERTYNENVENERTYDEATSRERSFSNTDEYLDHIFGKTPGKSYMSLVKELRDNLLNIDVDIIGELSDLFIKLW